MGRSGRSSFISVGYHFRLSAESTCERPRRNSPPGITRIPGGGVASTDAVRRRLAVNSLDVIRRNVAVRPKRIDVGISPPGGSVANLLAPVDTERRVHGGEDVLHARLLFAAPAGFDTLGPLRIGTAQYLAAFHTGAGEHRRIALVVMIAACHVVERSGSTAEFAHHHDQRLI